MTHVERHYSLKEAVTVFFPTGAVTISTLRTEIKKGHLPHARIAGKIVVTAKDIGEMLKRCRDEAKAQGSTSDATSGKQGQHGLSETERAKFAQDAAKQTATKLRDALRSTSQKNTNRQPKKNSLRNSA